MPKQIDRLAAERNRLLLENMKLKHILHSVQSSIRSSFESPGLPPRVRRAVEETLKPTLGMMDEVCSHLVVEN